MSAPEVSVVMSVYNGADTLKETLESILNQKDCDFEFIVVNDGSTDTSGSILDECSARDSRIRVIHQENTGLTRALIRGCSEARGEFIARQDAGDISLPGRLKQQCTYMRINPGCELVVNAVRFIGPGGEKLYDVVRHGDELEKGLSLLDVRKIIGPPHHGCTLFRKKAYLQAGGYRAEFHVAQDIDLWLRLAEQGRCTGLEEVRYLARLEAGSISRRSRPEQFRFAELAIECAKHRRNGMSDANLLDAKIQHPDKASKIEMVANPEKAKFYYFVASCLRNTDPISARRYYRLALQEQPFYLKALFRFVFG
jgi:glycosyltransferase involved in cell wall biosynthesis